MQVLFVHGMGRTGWSGWPMLQVLRDAGCSTHTFGYRVSTEAFDSIVLRLYQRLHALAADGDYALIGHSLGGVLLRGALTRTPALVPPPRHLFLLGSPVRSPRLAQRLRDLPVFRLATGDCGQLLASPARMAAVGWPHDIPVTVIAGAVGLRGRLSPFGHEPNDTVVADSEIMPEHPCERVDLGASHSLLPAHRGVARVVLDRLPRVSR